MTIFARWEMGLGSRDLTEGRDNIVHFPEKDGARVPFAVYKSHEIYAREQERIFRGDTWSFLGLEVEIPNPGDFKSTYVGDTPVVMTRDEDGNLAAWVNRCAHRGAAVCRLARGNALSHTCVYHQWNYSSRGDLQGVPFRKGQKNMTGMPADFDIKAHSLQKLRVESYSGLVFASFSNEVPSVRDYIGPENAPYIDRLFQKPIEYLGCTRQLSSSNWKLYIENVKDPYHASLLHLFHTTFNIFRVNMKARCLSDKTGMHTVIYAMKDDISSAQDYAAQKIRTYDERFNLEDHSILDLVQEYEDITTNHIQVIFPQLVLQQIHNSLVARQVLPKGPNGFEIIFHFFGYKDDSEELRRLRIKQANLVGPAGYISMEDTEATELVQRGVTGSEDKYSILEMSRSAPEEQATLISEGLVRKFWLGYQSIMGLNAPVTAAAE
jgi:anthranilate 1,2-dioxygenase large subunit